MTRASAAGEALPEMRGRVDYGVEGVVVDGIGQDENVFRRDPHGLDAALEMRGNDDDEPRALEGDAVGQARERQQPGLRADALVAGEFIDLDHEGDAMAPGEPGGDPQEEGVTFVDEVEAFAPEQGGEPATGDRIVGELEQFEDESWERARRGGRGGHDSLERKGLSPAVAVGVDGAGADKDDTMSQPPKGAGHAGDMDALRAGPLGARK